MNKQTNLIVISLVAAMGGYLFGFDFAVIAGALPFLKEQFGLNEYWEGFAAGSLALGAIAGCVVAGKTADRLGRKPALLMAAGVFAVSSLLMAFSPGLFFFICARFLAGIGVGMASMLSPMYIAEISPARVRGRMVATNQLTIVIGILVTNLVNYALRNNGTDAWRLMFGLGAVPSALFLAGVWWLPESPHWLVQAGKSEKAARVLHKLGDDQYVQNTLDSIHASLKKATKVNFATLLERQILPAVLIGIGLAVFQQLCGINVVFGYTSNIFESIGASKDDQLLQTVFIGGVNLVFTLLAMGLVDKLGRKPLMISGAIGLAALYILIALLLAGKSPYSGILILSAIGLYATTLGPITWVLIAEIFPNKVRSSAISVAVLCLWGAYFVLMYTFPILEKALTVYHPDGTVAVPGTGRAFYVYAAICAIGAVFIWKKIRETKGKSLEEMDAMFVH